MTVPVRRHIKKKEHRTNEEITVNEVRLVGENVEQGIYNIEAALDIAIDNGLDLVEISPNATPPVCRVVYYNKFLYEQKKKQKEQKANTVKNVVKEIRFGHTPMSMTSTLKLPMQKPFLMKETKCEPTCFLKVVQLFIKKEERYCYFNLLKR